MNFLSMLTNCHVEILVTDKTMAKIKMTKEQKSKNKTLHRKLQIEQHRDINRYIFFFFLRTFIDHFLYGHNNYFFSFHLLCSLNSLNRSLTT